MTNVDIKESRNWLKAAFKESIARLRKTFPKSKKGGPSHQIADHFKSKFGENILSHQTVMQILEAESHSQPVEAKNMLLVVAAEKYGGRDWLFELLAGQMNSDAKVDDLSDKHDGYYRYWRYYHGGTPSDPPTLRWGLVKIDTIKGHSTTLKHWSRDRILEITKDQAVGPTMTIQLIEEHTTEPEDFGYVLFTGSKMFMIGFRSENIRLAIASIPPGNNRARHVYPGGVLTTRADSGSIYMAGFVMVHQLNEAMFENGMTDEEFAAKSRFGDAQGKPIIGGR